MKFEQAQWRHIHHVARVCSALALVACGFDPRPFQEREQAARRMCEGGRCGGASGDTAGRVAAEPSITQTPPPPAMQPPAMQPATTPPPTTPSPPPPVATCLATPTAIASSCDEVCCGTADACCPRDCGASDDPDCSSQCGDGTLQPGETCEPDNRSAPCLKSCDDGDRCTMDALVGSAKNCNVRCLNTRITAASDFDGCCPAGATASNDSDCPRGPTCGDGVVEGDEACDGDPDCAADCQLRFQPSLAHRYSFEGVSGMATDSISAAHGRLVRAALNGHDLELSGSRGRVVLPGGLISKLRSATIELWITWRGGEPWQHLFEFSNMPSDPEDDVGRAFWNLCPMNGSGQLAVEMNFTRAFDPDNTYHLVGDALKPGVQQHVAVAFDGMAREARLYIDGQRVDVKAEINGMLRQIDDENVWIGASQFEEDPGVQGSIHEFRIYGSALTDEQVGKSFKQGPDPL